MNPFLITDQTLISFSGGRTSAYMLWKVLEANGGLPDKAKVCFANTGKEDEKTLEFVKECEERWNVPITWLEWRNSDTKFEVVNFNSASRNGEPFSELNRKRNYLPNSMARYCTIELKILTAQRYLTSIGWEEWDNFVGIRADEPRRVAKIRANPTEKNGVEKVMPLAIAGIGKHDVEKFWKSQPFNLNLPMINGTTFHGNCDLCYLKGGKQLLSLIKENPDRATWWIKEEEWAKTITKNQNSNGIKFRPSEGSYAEMLNFAKNQQDMFSPDDDEGMACFCGD
jgi:3'-phosphoadenosine 5'-phosphosulfate sulfotransferase (PAPS reductase)/FAD synthetase